MFTTAGLNAAAAGITGVAGFVGLAGATGTELAGGSPAYARKAITWAAASGGVVASSNAPTFDVAAAAVVAQLHFWSLVSGGTDYGWVPLGGFQVEAAEVQTSDVLTDYAHGLANDDRVYIYPVHTNALPTGLAENTLYFVVAAATDTFELSATQGGAPVNITANGKVLYQKCTPFNPPAQSTLPFSAGNITVDARLLT